MLFQQNKQLTGSVLGVQRTDDLKCWSQQTLTENSFLLWLVKVLILSNGKGMKSSSGKVYLPRFDLSSGKWPQLPGSNWKTPLIVIVIVVSVLKKVYILSKVWRLSLWSRPPIFSFHGFRALCHSSSSMTKPNTITKYNNEKYTSRQSTHEKYQCPDVRFSHQPTMTNDVQPTQRRDASSWSESKNAVTSGKY